jgi:hypothetical protein
LKHPQGVPRDSSIVGVGLAEEIPAGEERGWPVPGPLLLDGKVKFFPASLILK